MPKQTADMPEQAANKKRKVEEMSPSNTPQEEKDEGQKTQVSKKPRIKEDSKDQTAVKISPYQAMLNAMNLISRVDTGASALGNSVTTTPTKLSTSRANMTTPANESRVSRIVDNKNSDTNRPYTIFGKDQGSHVIAYSILKKFVGISSIGDGVMHVEALNNIQKRLLFIAQFGMTNEKKEGNNIQGSMNAEAKKAAQHIFSTEKEIENIKNHRNCFEEQNKNLKSLQETLESKNQAKKAMSLEILSRDTLNKAMDISYEIGMIQGKIEVINQQAINELHHIKVCDIALKKLREDRATILYEKCATLRSIASRNASLITSPHHTEYYANEKQGDAAGTQEFVASNFISRISDLINLFRTRDLPRDDVISKDEISTCLICLYGSKESTAKQPTHCHAQIIKANKSMFSDSGMIPVAQRVTMAGKISENRENMTKLTTVSGIEFVFSNIDSSSSSNPCTIDLANDYVNLLSLNMAALFHYPFFDKDADDHSLDNFQVSYYKNNQKEQKSTAAISSSSYGDNDKKSSSEVDILQQYSYDTIISKERFVDCLSLSVYMIFNSCSGLRYLGQDCRTEIIRRFVNNVIGENAKESQQGWKDFLKASYLKGPEVQSVQESKDKRFMELLLQDVLKKSRALEANFMNSPSSSPSKVENIAAIEAKNDNRDRQS